MLRFTTNQERSVHAQRNLFNSMQAILAQNSQNLISQLPAGLRNEVHGNAYSIGKDDWYEADTQSVELQRETLIIFNDLASISKATNLAYTAHEWNNVSDSGEVNISLDGRSMAKEDQAVLEYFITPIPIIDSVHAVGWRQKLAIEKGTTSLDMAGIGNSQRRVAEKLENIALNGDASIVINGTPLYGLRTAPKRLTGNFGVNFATSTGKEILDAFTAMVQKFIDNKHYGQVTFYLNYNDYFQLTAREYVDNYPAKIIDKLLGIAGVQAIIGAPTVPQKEVLGIVKSRNVYQVLNSMPMTTIALNRQNLTDDYRTRVMASAAVEFKYDANGKAGYGQFLTN